jgi:hypothetical protein
MKIGDSWRSNGDTMQRGEEEEDRRSNHGRDSFCSVPALMEPNTGNRAFIIVCCQAWSSSVLGIRIRRPPGSGSFFFTYKVVERTAIMLAK